MIIFGTAEQAELAHFYFTRDSDHPVTCFTVDDAYIKEESFKGLPIVPFSEIATSYPADKHPMFIAIGYSKMNHVRAAKFQEAVQLGYDLPGYVSSRCTLLTETPVGKNCFILEDNTIQPFVTIGNNVTLWSGNHIGHHSRIEDHCFITSHVVISGGCTIGAHSFIGVNASLRNAISIGEDSFIGMGVIMHKRTRPGEVYLPSRPQKWSKPSSELNF